MRAEYSSINSSPGWYNVTFMVVATGERLTRGFYSYSAYESFKRKLKYSKRCLMISCSEEK